MNESDIDKIEAAVRRAKELKQQRLDIQQIRKNIDDTRSSIMVVFTDNAGKNNLDTARLKLRTKTALATVLQKIEEEITKEIEAI